MAPTNGNGAGHDHADAADVERWRDDAQTFLETHAVADLAVMNHVTAKHAEKRAVRADERSADIYFQNGKMLTEVSKVAEKYDALARTQGETVQQIERILTSALNPIVDRVTKLELGPMREALSSMVEIPDDVDDETKAKLIDKHARDEAIFAAMQAQLAQSKRAEEDRALADKTLADATLKAEAKAEKKEKRFWDRVKGLGALIALVVVVGGYAKYAASCSPTTAAPAVTAPAH